MMFMLTDIRNAVSITCSKKGKSPGSATLTNRKHCTSWVFFFSCTAWFKECLTYIQDCCICSGEGLAMILAHSIMEISSCLRSRGRTLVITSNALQLSVLGNPGHEARLFLCILSSCPQLAIRHTWAPYSIWGITMLWYNGHFLWANRFRSSHHH